MSLCLIKLVHVIQILKWLKIIEFDVEINNTLSSLDFITEISPENNRHVPNEDTF